LGLTHDISRWINVFAEYDFYAYGRRNLDSFDQLDPNLPAAPGNVDRLTQHVKLNGYSVRLGLNLKLLDTFNPTATLSQLDSWMIYLGMFSGYTSIDFSAGANYFDNSSGLFNPVNQVFDIDTFQQGILVGGQVGVHYHLRSPYYFGLVFSGIINNSNARVTQHVQNVLTPLNQRAFAITDQFKINDNLDLAGLIGFDITPHTHIYTKFGASYAELTHGLVTTASQAFPFPMAGFQQTQRKDLWGWLLGLGLTQDLNKWVSAFVEYNYYHYDTVNLNSLDDIAPSASDINPDHLTQHVNIHASAVHLGLNLKFLNTFNPNYRVHTLHPNSWMLFLGSFAGYYSADHSYGANYFATGGAPAGPQNQLYNNDAFQHGLTWGAHIGSYYHFLKPYYLGLVFSAALNANKAPLSEFVESALAPITVRGTGINHQFQINYNVDLAVLVGRDITTYTRLYAKIGGTYAKLMDNVRFTLASPTSFPQTISQRNQRLHLWGYVLGLGFSHDLTKYLSFFAEYDHYDYPSKNLNTLNDINSGSSLQNPDLLTQHIKVSAYSVCVGLNVNFKI